MISFIVVVSLASIASSANTANLTSQPELPPNKGAIGPNALQFVVSVKGKTFLAEPSPSRNWTEANAVCRSAGYRLASITTYTEYTALIDAAENGTFRGEFWTSARDARLLRQLSWDGTDDQPPVFLDFDRPHGDYSSTSGLSIIFDKNQGHPNGRVFINPHSKKWGTLCESSNNSTEVSHSNKQQFD